jgi:CBS domain containing-hemolysin-like protein
MIAALAFAVAVVFLVAAVTAAAADSALVAATALPETPRGLEEIRERHDRIHRALGFTKLSCQLGAGFAAAVAADIALNGSGGIAELTWVVLIAFSLLVVGTADAIARGVGDSGGAALALKLVRFVRLQEIVAAPLVALSDRLQRRLDSILPRDQTVEEERLVTARQFMDMVGAEIEGSRGGGAEGRALLNGVFRLSETEVHDIMVPRVDIVALDRESTWAEVVEQVRRAEHSRLPVYAGTIDNIVGILYAKDLLPAVLEGREPPGGWTSLVRPAVFIPGSKRADQQLRDFRNSGTHIAIVVDEYGGTAGLVTIEDVLEEIVGDIRDEYDVEEPSIVQEEGRRFWVSARVTLKELSELLQHDFEREDVATVGGLVYERLGRVPRAGEEFRIDGFRVVVERVERRRVRRVYFERLDTDRENAA